MISVRLSIFDTKDQKKAFALHSLHGITSLLKAFALFGNKELYQEIMELNLRYLVRKFIIFYLKVSVCLWAKKSD